MFDPKKILVLAPHTDDGELGCGASIAKFCAEGREVYYAAFCLCAKSLPKDLPPKSTVFHYFNEWRKNETWKLFNTDLHSGLKLVIRNQFMPSKPIEVAYYSAMESRLV